MRLIPGVQRMPTSWVRASRSLAGNPASPQAGVLLTLIIDEIVGVATYYIHYHAI